MTVFLISVEKNTIFKRIVEGDKNAFSDCVDKYRGFVWSLAKKYLPTIEDAEDATQDIFLEIWEKAERYDVNKASELTFIAVIARRRLIDKIRKIYRTPIMSSIDDFFQSPNNNFEDELHRRIEVKKVVKMMSVLSLEQKTLMMLTIFEGLSHREIANKTGIQLGSVKTYIRRGFRRVREILNVNPQNLVNE